MPCLRRRANAERSDAAALNLLRDVIAAAKRLQPADRVYVASHDLLNLAKALALLPSNDARRDEQLLSEIGELRASETQGWTMVGDADAGPDVPCAPTTPERVVGLWTALVALTSSTNNGHVVRLAHARAAAAAGGAVRPGGRRAGGDGAGLDEGQRRGGAAAERGGERGAQRGQ